MKTKEIMTQPVKISLNCKKDDKQVLKLTTNNQTFEENEINLRHGRYAPLINAKIDPDRIKELLGKKRIFRLKWHFLQNGNVIQIDLLDRNQNLLGELYSKAKILG